MGQHGERGDWNEAAARGAARALPPHEAAVMVASRRLAASCRGLTLGASGCAVKAGVCLGA